MITDRLMSSKKRAGGKKKRGEEEDGTSKGGKRLHADPSVPVEMEDVELAETADSLEFEDAFDEEFEEEEEIVDRGMEEDEDESMLYDGKTLPSIHEEEEEEGGPNKMWRPGHEELAE